MMNRERTFLSRMITNICLAIVAFGIINIVVSLFTGFDTLGQTIILTLTTGGLIGLIAGLGNLGPNSGAIAGGVVAVFTFIVFTGIAIHSMAQEVSIPISGYFRIAFVGFIEGLVTGWITGNLNA